MGVSLFLRGEVRIAWKGLQEIVEGGVALLRPTQVQSGVERIGNSKFDGAKCDAPEECDSSGARCEVAGRATESR